MALQIIDLFASVTIYKVFGCVQFQRATANNRLDEIGKKKKTFSKMLLHTFPTTSSVKDQKSLLRIGMMVKGVWVCVCVLE